MAKKKRIKERTFGTSIRYGALITFLTALVCFIALMSDHNSGFYSIYRIATTGVIVSPTSALYQMWVRQVDTEELLLAPIALLAGGIGIALLAPARISFKDVLIGCAKMSGVLVLAAFLFEWIVLIVEQSYKINPGQFSLTLALVEIVKSAAYIAACILGGAIGYGLRALRGRSAAPAHR